jgi:hypothetical protein
LLEHPVNQGRFAMIDVGDNCDITDVFSYWSHTLSLPLMLSVIFKLMSILANSCYLKIVSNWA